MPDDIEIEQPGETGMASLGGMFEIVDRMQGVGDAKDKERAGQVQDPEADADLGQQTEADRLAAEAKKGEDKSTLEKDKALAEKTNGAENSYPSTVKGEQARKHFDTLKSQKDAALRERDELKRKYTELETRANQANPELEKIKAEREQLAKERDELKTKAAELGKVVALKAIEETDEFKTKVTAPKQEALEEVQGMAKAYDLDMGKINEAIMQPDKHLRWKAIKALCDGSEVDPSELKTQINKWIDAGDAERKLREEQAGNQEFASRAQVEKDAKDRLQRTEEWKTSRTDLQTKLEKILTDGFQDKDGSPQLVGLLKEPGMKEIWDEGVKQIEEDPAAFEKLPAKEKVFRTIMGHIGLGMLKNMHASLMKERATIAARNGSRQGGGHGSAMGEKGEDKRQIWDMLEDVPGPT